MNRAVHQFQIDPNSGVPIYRQLIDQVMALVAGGKLRPGDTLPSVRQVSEAAAVNPMTVSKAYARLELDGVVERLRGQGMRVRAVAAADGSLAERQQQWRALVEPVIHRGRQLGLTDVQIRAVVDRVLREMGR